MKNLHELALIWMVTCFALVLASPSASAQPDKNWIISQSTVLDHGASVELGSDGAVFGDTVVASGPFGASVFRGSISGQLMFEASLRPIFAADRSIFVHTAIDEDTIALGVRYDNAGPDDVLQVYEREGETWSLVHTEMFESYRGYAAEIQNLAFDQGRLIVSLRADLGPPDYPTSSWMSVRARGEDGVWGEVQTIPDNPFDPMFYDLSLGEFTSAWGGLLLAMIYRPLDDQEAPDRVFAYTFTNGSYVKTQEFEAPAGTSNLFGESTAVNEELIAIVQSGEGAYVTTRNALPSSAALVSLPLPPDVVEFGDRIALGQGTGADLIAVRVHVDDGSTTFGHTAVAVYRFNGGAPTFEKLITSRDVSADESFFAEELGVSGEVIFATSSWSVAPDEATLPVDDDLRNGSFALYNCANECQFTFQSFGSSPNASGFGVKAATNSRQLFLRQLTGRQDPRSVIHVFDLPEAGRLSPRAAQVLAHPQEVMLADVGRGAFGEQFAASEELLVVTGYKDDGPAVFVFRFESNAWGYVATIESPTSSRFFGKTLAIQGEDIFIGDTLEQNGQGVVYRATSSVPGQWGITTDYKLEESTASDFGDAIAVTRDALFVGAPEQGDGAVYRFALSTSDRSTLMAPESLPLLGDQTRRAFGESLASADGWLAVGELGTRSVHLFELDETDKPLFKQTITDAGADLFGESLAITSEFLVIGGYNMARAWFNDGEGRWDALDKADLIDAAEVAPANSLVQVGLVEQGVLVTLPVAAHNHPTSGRAILATLGAGQPVVGNANPNNVTPNNNTPANNTTAGNNTTPANNNSANSNTPANNTSAPEPGPGADVPTQLPDYGCASAKKRVPATPWRVLFLTMLFGVVARWRVRTRRGR